MSAAAVPLTPAAHVGAERIAAGRLWWVGLLTAVATAVITVVVRTVGVGVGTIPGTYQSLQLPSVIMASVVPALVATVVLALLGRFTRRPIRAFRAIAAVALVVSFAGPLQAGAGVMPGGAVGAATVGTMLALHVVAASVIVGLLNTLGRAT